MIPIGSCRSAGSGARTARTARSSWSRRATTSGAGTSAPPLIVDGAPARVTLMRRVGGGRRAIRLDRPVPRGAELSVRLADLPAPEPDSYYAFQLVGLAVFDDAGAPVGVVSEVLPGPANDNLELDDGRLVADRGRDRRSTSRREGRGARLPR